MRAWILAPLLFSAAFTANAAAAATLSYNLAPVTFCDDITAPCEAPNLDDAFFQDIYAQIDIGVNILAATELRSLALPLTPSGEIEIFDALSDFGQAQRNLGLAPSTIYMGFIAADFDGAAIGLAYVDDLHFPFGIVQNATYAAATITRAAAHEAGHVLGGEHDNAGPGDLLAPELDPSAVGAPPISAANAAAMRSSALLQVTPVPLSGAGLYLAAALAMVALRRK